MKAFPTRINFFLMNENIEWISYFMQYSFKHTMFIFQKKKKKPFICIYCSRGLYVEINEKKKSYTRPMQF